MKQIHNVDVVATVLVSISAACGVVAGLFGVRYFDAKTSLHRFYVFWPIFWLVGFVVFVIGVLLVEVLTGSLK
jgi:H+/Cl- antiporter ClcA